MDEERELARAKWAMLVFVVFVISAWISYDELALFVNGRDAEADVTKAYLSHSRRGSRLTIEYAFTEPDGTRRKAMMTTSPDAPPPAPNAKLAVRYTPGESGNVRLAGRVNWIAITIFGASLCAILFVIVKLVREANDDAPRRKRR
jgi:hypothetical protein